LGNRIISVKQLAVLVYFCVLGDSIIIAPSLLASFAEEDAWISGLVGIAVGLSLLALIYRVGRIRSGESIVELNRTLLGQWAGGAVSLFLIFYFIVNAGTMIRSIGDFVTTQMMPETPIRAIHLMLALILVWALRAGIETVGRTAELFFPWFVILLLGLMAALLPKVEIEHILPVGAHGAIPIVQGSAFMTLYPFAESIVLLAILPNVAKAKHALRDFLLAALLGGLTIVAIILVCLLVLGPYLTAHQTYPTYALAKQISIGNFVERVEAILAFLWIVSLLFKIILYGYAFVNGLAKLFRFRDENVLVFPSTFLFFGLAYVVSPNVVYFSEVAVRQYWPYWDFTVAIVIPLLLLAVSAIRRGRGKSSSSG
jgi:spore germination protein (amino acid permease)